MYSEQYSSFYIIFPAVSVYISAAPFPHAHLSYLYTQSSTEHAGSEGRGGRCRAAEAGVGDTISGETQRDREGGGEGKKTNRVGRSLFLARRRNKRRCDRRESKHQTFAVRVSVL